MLEELIRHINEVTDMRVEIFYYVDSSLEGYKACFYADSKEDYQMQEVYDNPKDAVLRLAKEYGITL